MNQFLFDNPINIVISSLDGTIEEQNQKALNCFGDQSGSNIIELIHPSHRSELSEIVEFPDSSACQTYFTSQKGQHFFARLTASVEGKQICWFIEDQQDSVELQKKMEAYKSIPSDYGHELNNLLTIIISACDLILMSTEDESIIEDTQNILETSCRAATRNRSFLELGRKLFLSKERISLYSYLSDMLPFLQEIIGSKNSLTLIDTEQNPMIYVPRVSLLSILSQICTHLRFTHSGFEYSLLISCEEITPPVSSNILGVVSGAYTIISFVQKGFPFSEELLNRSQYCSELHAESLSPIWHFILSCSGSITQRVSDDGLYSLNIYLPTENITY